jgi:hypothetical protein
MNPLRVFHWPNEDPQPAEGKADAAYFTANPGKLTVLGVWPPPPPYSS